MKLRKVNESAQLLSLVNPYVSFVRVDLEDENLPEHSEYKRIKDALKPFTSQFDKVKNRDISTLMESLSELISMNPNYSHEKMIVDKFITFIFHQYWSKLLSREEQQYLVESINKYFMQCISMQSFSLNQGQQLPLGPPSG